MRKLLLASAATMGATLAMAGGAKAQPLKPVAAGTLVVHINGYFQFSLAAFGSSDNNVYSSSSGGTFKLNPIGTTGDFRLYPGFDGLTTNGVNYGVQVELRTGYTDSGVGQNGKSTTTATISSSTTSVTTSTTDALYVKRAYGYIGTPEIGYFRLGQTDSAFTLLQTGVIEAFGDGGQWTLEGGVKDILPTDAAPVSTVIYADQAAVYSTDKLVYISPAVPVGPGTVSGAFGYEPNSDGIKEGYNNYAAAGSLTPIGSSPVASDIGKKRKNTIDVAGQYLLKYNGAAIKANAGFLYGTPVNYDGTKVVTPGSPLVRGFSPLEVYQIGAQVTYLGATLGANIKGGDVLDGYAFAPKGARAAITYMISGDYVIGPYVIGASYFNQQTAGAYVPGNTSHIAKTLTEYGIAVGGNYVFNPHFSLFTQYMYGSRHQAGNTGIDLNDPDVSATGHITHGSARVQVIAAGATFKW